MTELRPGKKVTRRLLSKIQGKQIVVSIHQQFVQVRREHTRDSYNVSWESIFLLGAQRAADKAASEKKLAKRMKKSAR